MPIPLLLTVTMPVLCLFTADETIFLSVGEKNRKTIISVQLTISVRRILFLKFLTFSALCVAYGVTAHARSWYADRCFAVDVHL